MKAILRSIKPYWLYLILIGKKTVEIGKTFPKSEDWSKTVFLYCSKDMRSFNRIPPKDRVWMLEYLGKVACEFVCDSIMTMSWIITPKYPMWKDGFNEEMCLTNRELFEYSKGGIFYEWNISDLVIYGEPKKLSEFYHECNGVCVDTKKNVKCERIMVDGFSCNGLLPITRPPQSWCYVEVQG